MSKPPEVMNISDVAGYLRIPVSSAYKLAQDGLIPARKVGRHWRIHREVLIAWMRNSEPAALPRARSGT